MYTDTNDYFIVLKLRKYIFDVYIITCDDLHLIDAQIVVNPHFLRLDLIYGLRSMQTCFLNCSNDIKNSR